MISSLCCVIHLIQVPVGIGKIPYLLFFLISPSFLFGQSTYSFKTEKVIKGAFQDFSVDNFGRISLAKNDVVQLLSKEYDTLFTTSLKTVFPSSIESRKSFRTLVFDLDRSVIQFLDNTLTDIHGQIDLVNIGIQQPILVAESFNGNTFWVLDAANLRLVQLNAKLEVIKQTENLIHLFDSESEPSKMIEGNDYLYILVPEKGVAIFDVFGTFIKFLEQPGEFISVLDNYLLVMKDDQVFAFNSVDFFGQTAVYDTPKNTKAFFFSRNLTYFLTDNDLTIGKFLKSDK